MTGFIYVTATGIIVPDTGTTKSEVQAEFVAALGADLVLDDATPQGRLIDVEVAARDAYVRTMAEFANQINPNVAVGTFLEAICGLHGVQPVIATYSVASNCILTGSEGTFVPASSRVSSATGDIFSTVNDVTIGVGGTVTVDVVAIVAGGVVAAADSITKIIDGILGWTAITNPAAAVEGVAASTDQSLRIERKQLLSIMSKGTSEAIQSNVKGVTGVISLQQRENPSSGNENVDGVHMTPHSTWVCVQGGSDEDVALALFKSKQSGSPWTSGTGNGAPVTVNVTDPNSGQVYPVLFTRGTEIPIIVRVTISMGTTTADPNVTIPAAIFEYAAGTMPGEVGFVLGADASPFELAGAISRNTPGVFVKNVEVGTVASPIYGNTPVAIDLWEYASIAGSNIIILVVA